MLDTDRIVPRHGRLATSGGRIVDRYGQPFELRGMSLFWSQWMPQFYSAGTVRWLHRDWGCNAVRAALAVNFGGYRQDPEAEWRKLAAVVEAAIAEEIYVLVDWHVHEMEIISAAGFFDRLSRAYGDVPNVIYEIWNEPYPRYEWGAHIRPYCREIIPIIRRNAPHSLIVAGTPTYSQRPDLAADAPLDFENVAYAMHFYAASHRGTFRDYCAAALSRRLPLLASEYGTCESTGDGRFAPEETQAWWSFLRRHHIGHFNWSIADKLETAAALLPGASPDGNWPVSSLTPSGQLVRAYLRSRARDGAVDMADSRAQVGGQ